MASNKEWMTAPRLSTEYLQGVEEFLEFLRANKENLGGDDWYCCPCVKCRNIVGGKKTLRDIREHLICDGVDTSYTIWTHHGEIYPPSRLNMDSTNHNEDAFPRMVDMVNDVFARVPVEDNVAHMGGNATACMDEDNHEEDVQAQDNSPENIQYKKLMEDAIQPLYPSCQIEDTKLSVTVGLLSMKARHKWSKKSFTELLQMIKKILPNHNTLPDNTYNAKKMIKSLRMEQKIIHACRNDCILFWKEHENRDTCPKCEEIDEIKQVLSQGGMQHSSTCYESSSQAQDGTPREELRTGTNQNTTSHTREGSCRLLSYLRKEVTVAVGRVMGLSIDEGGCYRIVIDGILKADELLLGGDMTFGDLTLGDIISWPIFRTVVD